MGDFLALTKVPSKILRRPSKGEPEAGTPFGILKVNKFQNEFRKSSFLPKYEQDFCPW